MQQYEYITIYPDQSLYLGKYLNELNRDRWRPILVFGNQLILERPVDEVNTVDLDYISKDIIDAYVKRMNESSSPLRSSQIMPK